jgi:hypothetical protein
LHTGWESSVDCDVAEAPAVVAARAARIRDSMVYGLPDVDD